MSRFSLIGIGTGFNDQAAGTPPSSRSLQKGRRSKGRRGKGSSGVAASNMSPQYVESDQGATVGAGNMTFTIPAGVPDGAALVAVIQWGGQTTDTVRTFTNTGWSTALSSTDDSTSGLYHGVTVMTKAASGETGGGTWTFTKNVSCPAIGKVYVLPSFSTTLDVSSTVQARNFLTGNDANLLTLARTPAVDNSFIIHLVSRNFAGSGSLPGTSFSDFGATVAAKIDEKTLFNNNAAYYVNGVVGSYTQTTATITTAQAYVMTGSAGINWKMCWGVIIVPPA